MGRSTSLMALPVGSLAQGYGAILEGEEELARFSSRHRPKDNLIWPTDVHKFLRDSTVAVLSFSPSL